MRLSRLGNPMLYVYQRFRGNFSETKALFNENQQNSGNTNILNATAGAMSMNTRKYVGKGVF